MLCTDGGRLDILSILLYKAGEKSMISSNLKRFRKLFKLTQESVADRIGVSRQAVAKWETGETIPDINSCTALAEMFGVTLDDLVRETNDEVINIKQAKGKYIFGMVKVGAHGQIVIPKKAREIFKIQQGDSLLVLGDESQGLGLVKGDAFVEFAQAILDNKDIQEE